MKFLSVFLILLWAFPGLATNDLLSQGYEKITLQVGEQKRIHMANVTRVVVSRRGVIHILDEDKENCHFTGLRAGVVAVTFYKRMGDKKTVYVEVRPKETKSTASNRSALPDAFKEGAPPSPKSTYLVRTYVELIETQSAESQGRNGDVGLTVDLISKSASARASTVLAGRTETGRKSVIAKPSFLVTEDEEAVMKSGGEAIHDRLNEEGHAQPVWQEFGMALSVLVKKTPTPNLNAGVQFILKTPSSGPDRYSLNQIQTTAILKPNERSLIGTVDLASDNQSGRDDIFLAKIPIIGPLFRYSSKSAAKALVQLWLEVSEQPSQSQ